MAEINQDIADRILFDLVNMLSGFLEVSRFLVESHVEVSGPAIQAAKARAARQDSPEERALLRAVQDAIENKTPDQIATRGFSSRILSQVNRSVTKAGFKEVDVDKVRRRLKNLRS